MRFFAQADEIFDGNETTCEAEDHVDRDEAPELKPGKGGAIDTKPNRLTNDNICFGGNFGGKTFVEEVDDGKDSARKRYEGKYEKSPAGPDVGKCSCDDIVQTAPADEDEEQC